MNIHLPITLFPSILFLLLCVIPTSTILWIYKQKNRRKKSPLNIELLRSPGETLRDEIYELTLDILMKVFLIPTSSILIYAIITTQFAANIERKFDLFTLVIYLLFGFGLIIYLMQNVFKLLNKRNKLRMGYDCELAVGQELNNRMRDGFNVFHDFPADGFNIDHVLIGSTGVFAVETKGRAKNRVSENGNWRLKFDGEKLIFPSWIETKPITQAVSQAQWLEEWINKTTGAPCKVQPVLAIPGWFIDRTSPSELKVYNGKNSSFLVKGKPILSPQQIQVISHQVEQKCRTVTSSAYKQDDDKK